LHWTGPEVSPWVKRQKRIAAISKVIPRPWHLCYLVWTTVWGFKPFGAKAPEYGAEK
jgi:hypothetical protein